MDRQPRACSFSTTNEPKKPAPPVTKTRLALQFMFRHRWSVAQVQIRDIRIDHKPY